VCARPMIPMPSGSTDELQFVQEPPLKSAVPVPMLVTVLVKVAPLIMYTSVLFALQITAPVMLSPEHEFTVLAVGIVARLTLPSTGTRKTPVALCSQSPAGA
jgi:hypothetical protein